MHFLIDASLPRSTSSVIRGRGHNATDVRDIGLGGSPDHDISAQAQTTRSAILTRDFDFADVRNYPPDQFAGIAVLDLPNSATATFILDLIDAFLQRADVINDLPGRLAIVQPGRIRLRPKP